MKRAPFGCHGPLPRGRQAFQVDQFDVPFLINFSESMVTSFFLMVTGRVDTTFVGCIGLFGAATFVGFRQHVKYSRAVSCFRSCGCILPDAMRCVDNSLRYWFALLRKIQVLCIQVLVLETTKLLEGEALGSLKNSFNMDQACIQAFQAL